MKSLKQKRLEKGLTVRELASMLGISRQTVCNYEKKRHRPPKRIRDKMKKILDLEEDVDYFKSKTPKQPPRCIVCGKKSKTRGLCQKHYQIWYKYYRCGKKNILSPKEALSDLIKRCR